MYTNFQLECEIPDKYLYAFVVQKKSFFRATKCLHIYKPIYGAEEDLNYYSDWFDLDTGDLLPDQRKLRYMHNAYKAKEAYHEPVTAIGTPANV